MPDDSQRVILFDTTLRDGEQSPGISLNTNEKLEIAHQLARLGVDVIEAGFPIASTGDFEAVREIATTFRGSRICGLARCADGDIDRAWEAVKHCDNPRIHVFLATSAIHREFKLRMTVDQIVDRAVAGVRRAAGYCDDIEFSPEDAARTEHDFLCRVVEAVIDAGATTVNIPDTVGYATPDGMYRVIKTLVDRVPNIGRATISVHCHDDLGLAVANSLAAVEAGAGQVECTVNGIGERAGNCALEEVAMVLKTRQDHYRAGTGIETRRLVPTSRLVQAITGSRVQRNKAIVGANAFAHESGIHQDGMLKERSTYEIMRPEDVGFAKTDLVLGKHSGRAALADRVRSLGYRLTAEQLQSVFTQFKDLADRKKEIYDGDIVALIRKEIREVPAEEWTLEAFRVRSGSGRPPKVRLTLRRGDESFTEETTDGDGAIDAAFLCVQAITGVELLCKDYRVQSATLGHDAQAEVNLLVAYQGQEVRGIGVSTDTVEATVHAILSCLNQVVHLEGQPGERLHPQQDQPAP